MKILNCMNKTITIILAIITIVLVILLLDSKKYLHISSSIKYDPYSFEVTGWLKPDYDAQSEIYQIVSISSDNTYLQNPIVTLSETWFLSNSINFDHIEFLTVIEKTDHSITVGNDGWTFYITKDAVRFTDKQGDTGILSDIRVRL